MNGDWEFYYGRFIEPEEINSKTVIPEYCKVPSLWESGTGNLKDVKGTGYGTYHCRVLLPTGYKKILGLDVPAFETAYELYINGKLTSSCGKPGKNKNEASPGYNPRFVRISPNSDTIDILVKVSNFEVSKGGFWLPMKIGTYNEIQRSFTNTWIGVTISSSMLFIIFVFALFIFLQKPNDSKQFAFALVILSLALRPLFSTPYLITLLDDVSWPFIIRAGYFSLYMLVIGGIWFVHSLFPTKYSVQFMRAVPFIAAILLPAPFILNPYLLTCTDPLISTLALIIVSYAMVMSLLRIKERKKVGILYSLAILLIGFGVYSDIKLSIGKEVGHGIFIASFTFLIYALLQSALMIREWMKNSNEKVRLYIKFEELAKNLELRVEERTLELSRKNTEIEEQYKLIAEQNKKLSDTLDVKNRIFSVISHDLRSPIVNILYGLNLIKDDETGLEKEMLANACIKNSKMAIHLLENMLIWGREQNDQIHYSPDMHDIADIVLTNMSIYKENADKKNISLNFIQIGSSKGWFDKDLVDIIIRNLLSNSIKFTGHNGRVSISVKGKENIDEGLLIKISDNGVGMPKEKIETLFTGKGVQSTFGTDNEKGTGIGLRLVYDLVRISHGTITAESTQSAGTTFTIVLPGQTSNSHILRDFACN
jgi:signal transduction histidine kinase